MPSLWVSRAGAGVSWRRFFSLSPSRSGGAAARIGVRLAFGLFLLTAVTANVTAQVSPGPLARAHADLDKPLSCLKCHGAGSSSLDQHCLKCHEAIDWTMKQGRGLHGHLQKTACAPCHPDHVGRDFALISWDEGSPERFDHLRSGFRLEGRHATLKCQDCHRAEHQHDDIIKLLRRTRPADSWLGLQRDCVSCHEDIHQKTLGETCTVCHEQTAWKPAARFDHAKSDYPLTGRHTDVACDKCHLAPGVEPLVDRKGARHPRYKPLPHRECSDCHNDPHVGRVGPACGRCHVTSSFRTINRDRFDHAVTRYPLRGRHVGIECAKCHDPKTAWGRTPPFGTCADCHSDPHAGKATQAGKAVDCAACHRVEGFTPSTYDVTRHDTSRYPLKGQHRVVRCSACHAKKPPGVSLSTLGKAGVPLRPSFGRCGDCHQDAHAGQLAKRKDKGACEACHLVEGWAPTTFSVKDHAGLRLPLQKRHATVKCAACHGPVRPGLPSLPGKKTLGSAGVSLTLLSSECSTCHYDPHDGRFSSGGERPKERACLACHDANAFRPARVDIAAHKSSRFALNGSHRAVPCVDCHAELKRPAPTVRLMAVRGSPRSLSFIEEERRCRDCHESVHGDQFAARKDKSACDACHNEDVFRPASRFDHTKHARFVLDGAHINVKCDRCHPTGVLAGGRRQIVYRPLNSNCESCHTPTELQRRSRSPVDGSK
jgi:hypothetical protein